MHSMQPLVSIGLPVYNGESSLEKCLENLLRQDYKNIELIISDNASTDSTPIISKKYKGKDSRVKYYLNSQNIGGARNFSRVCELAKGKYFMWAAHDDLYDRTFIQKCIQKLEAHPNAIMCLSHINLINQNGLPLGQLRTVETINQDIEQRLKSFFKGWFPYGLYKANIVKQPGLILEDFGWDIILGLRLTFMGEVITVEEPLLTYTIDQNKTFVDQTKSITTDISKRELILQNPYSRMLKNLYETIKMSNENDTIKQKLFDYFLQQHIRRDNPWMHNAIQENKEILGDKINDFTFIYNLFIQWFNSNLTLEEIYRTM